MKYLDLTLPSAAENLACDEALLDWLEPKGEPEVLRVWEPRAHFVVLGYANKARLEVNLDACRERHIPILRRCSGGGTVLQGPGCLNYSLLLKIEGAPALQSISQTNGFIMQRNAQALTSLLGCSVAVQGFTDLAISNLKFSGNAQRRKRGWILFHGTFLLDFKLALMDDLLRFPSQQPAYRQNRSHAEFLTQLRLPAALVKSALRKHWQASRPLMEIPHLMIDQLARNKYSTDEWNFRW
jgi:lipoate-protein ligase A